MKSSLNLFIGTFTTLLAVVNPLESLPIFMGLLAGQDEAAHKKVARQSCIYATLLTFFFLVFGTLMLKLFSVPLSMIRIVGGIILMRIGFSLFLPSPAAEKFSPLLRVGISLSCPWPCPSCLDPASWPRSWGGVQWCATPSPTLPA